MASSKTADLDETSRFIVAIAAFIDTLSGDSSSVAKDIATTLDAMQGQVPPSQRRDGVRQCLADMLEWTKDLSPAQLGQAEAFLHTRGVTSLSVMRERVWRQVPKILKRGLIKTEAEYRLLVAKLSDTADTSLTGPERDQADKLISDFEAVVSRA